ncbi:hypothetical protein HPP92_016928 [Vanilla planifolia]|uniref:Uncharacterized protein n=1 Tax=Vanilla planifolia TaxID=51239 RepID=A0A835QL16_VANPL|nr:hypothetical protein HPP92_017522 [Vanilla planifolia]KAG0472382.1 hypothetical protein HPP92_016928 [Vanilla planifolia]
MSGKEEARIFVGGLSWETSERQLEAAFSRFGKVLDAQIMVERDTGRPRGFGFVTFTDKRAMEAAISEMHNKELGGRQISVNKAEPKVGSDDPGYGYGSSGGYSSGGRGSYRGGVDDPLDVGRSDCFKCGRPGHWARECPSVGAGGGGRFSSRPRIGGGGRGDRFGGGERYNDRYVDDRYDGGRYDGGRYDGGRYDGGRYGDRDRLDGRESGRYSGGRDRYANERYPSTGDRFSGERYGGASERYPPNAYSKERNFDRDGGPRGGGGGGGGGGDRYGSGGPSRYEGGGGGYRERPGPYDRPSRGGRPSFDDRY